MPTPIDDASLITVAGDTLFTVTLDVPTEENVGVAPARKLVPEIVTDSY